MRLSPEFILDSIRDNLSDFHSKLTVNGKRVKALIVDDNGVTLALEDGSALVFGSEL